MERMAISDMRITTLGHVSSPINAPSDTTPITPLKVASLGVPPPPRLSTHPTLQLPTITQFVRSHVKLPFSLITWLDSVCSIASLIIPIRMSPADALV